MIFLLQMKYISDWTVEVRQDEIQPAIGLKTLPVKNTVVDYKKSN